MSIKNIRRSKGISNRTYFHCAVFLVLCFPAVVANAATNITANITSDTVWTKNAGPYVVINNISVTSGSVLTIEAGTIVKFDGTKKLDVAGTLSINGVEGDLVYITSIHDDSIGGDTNENGSNTSVDTISHRWTGISFAPGSSGEVKYASLQFAGYASPSVPSQPALYNQGGVVSAHNSVFENNNFYGVGQTAGTLSVINSTIRNQFVGAVIKNGDATFENVLFKNSWGYGCMIGGAGKLELTGNTFEDNYITGGFWLDGGRQFVLQDNSASGGEFNGFLLRGQVTGENTLPKSDGISYYVSGVGGSADGTGALSFPNFSNLEILAGASLTLEPGAVLKSDTAAGLEVRGQLVASGTSDDPVTFTAYTDTLQGGIRSGTPSPGSAGYIRTHLGGVVSLNQTIILYGSAPHQSFQSTLVNIGGSITVTNSSITDNKQHALYHQSGTSVVNNSFVGDVSRFGIFNATTIPLDATNNYWGDPNGPTHDTLNPTGMGAFVSDNVLISPWLASYNPNPPPPPPPVVTGASSVLFLPGIRGQGFMKMSMLAVRTVNKKVGLPLMSANNSGY